MRGEGSHHCWSHRPGAYATLHHISPSGMPIIATVLGPPHGELALLNERGPHGASQTAPLRAGLQQCALRALSAAMCPWIDGTQHGYEQGRAEEARRDMARAEYRNLASAHPLLLFAECPYKPPRAILHEPCNNSGRARPRRPW
jgi:hypothetical protein